MENNKCELLECKSRKAVENLVKDFKSSYISRMELPYNHRLTKEEIEDIPSYINTDKLTQICLINAFSDPLHTSNKYLASQLMVQLIDSFGLNGVDVYDKLIFKTQAARNYDVYYFLETDLRGQTCLSLAKNGKKIGEPILTARQFKKALLKIINTQGDHYFNSGLYDLYTSVLTPVINWNLPFGPINSFAAVPIPTR